MTIRVRIVQRLSRGISLVSYQKPQDALIGIAILLLIAFYFLISIFGDWLGWVISVFVFIMWVNAISQGGPFAKLLWSFALLITCFTIWTSEGCPGNATYCAKMETDRIASEKQEAIERAAQRMETCALLTDSDWHSDPECRIYTEPEILTARARHNAKEGEEIARKNADAQREESERRARIQNDLDTFRKTR